MKSKLILINILFSFVIGQKSFASADLIQKTNLKKMNKSKIRLAKKFKETLSNEKNLNVKNINYLLRHIKNKSEFISYIYPLKNLRSVLIANRKSVLLKRCTAIERKSFIDNLTKNFCLKAISKRYKHIDDPYINRYLQQVLEVRRSSILRDVFSRKNKLNRNNFLSSQISTYILNNEITPKKILIPFLQMNSKMSLFLNKIQIFKEDRDDILQKKMKLVFTPMYKKLSSSNNDQCNVSSQEAHELKPFLNKESTQLLSNPKTVKSIVFYLKSMKAYNCPNLVQIVSDELLKSNERNEGWNKILFENIWLSISNNNYPEVFKKLEKYKVEKFESLSSQLQYWLASSYLKVNNEEKSTNIFKNIIDTDPISYYGVLSLKMLKKSGDKSPFKYIYRNIAQEKLSINNSDLSISFNNTLNQFLLWRLVQFDQLAFESQQKIKSFSNELVIKNNHKKDINTDLFKNNLISYGLYYTNNHLKNFRFLYKNYLQENEVINENLLTKLFPKNYLKRIKKYTDDVKPNLVLSLIRQESGFNPKAISRVGARGLMQLMPATARSLQRRVRIHSLKNPYINIRLGVKYLERLYSKYQKNLVHTLAAYNAGPGNLKKWMNHYFSNNPSTYNIEEIPFSETNKYVKLIYRNLFFYNLNSGQEDPFEKLDQVAIN